MTVKEIFKITEKKLYESGCETASFDATCILEDIGQIGRGRLNARRDETLPQTLEHAVLEAAKRRADGYPLQYLLGTWDFLGLTLEIGEGVLIPRPETELLCEEVVRRV
ncbi:MAG: peptide chain release factor N(5)-glutamine methyltransferase, partial [Clostridia bacterium]|nr:peptide chain release factor N(5)-glutamine methyltransferase [Clostridia bacterium]